MAKLSDLERTRLLADWKTGKYSQRDLVKKYNASKGTVSEITKGVEQKNGHLVDAQVSILSAKAILPPEEMGAIMGTAQEIIYNQGLITNATQLNLVRVSQYLSNNKKLEKVSVGMGIQHFEEVGLGASDFKECQDAIDKASITLGINQRHANTTINNTNASQTNTKYVGFVPMSEERKKEIMAENGRN